MPPAKASPPPKLSLASSIKVPPANTLLKPILVHLSQGERRYSDLRLKLAAEFHVPAKMVGVSVIDRETGEEVSFDMIFTDAMNHLQNASLTRRMKKMVSVVPGWEAKTIPAYVPPKRRKRQRTPQPTTAKLTGEINVDKLLSSLPDRDPFSLLKMWKNAIRILGDKDRASQQGKAASMAAAISKEWDRRAKSMPDDAYFKWPNTDTPGGGRHEHCRGLRGEGMLRYLEYQVGKNGGHSSLRQALLSRIFEDALPPVFDRVYMADWGANGTSVRLHKMAHCLATFARNFKYQDDDKFDEAIRHWEADLEFLHDKYYLGTFGFGWPSTTI